MQNKTIQTTTLFFRYFFIFIWCVKFSRKLWLLFFLIFFHLHTQERFLFLWRCIYTGAVWYYNHLNQAMPLVILTEDQQVTYTPYMYSSISFVYNVVQHQHFVFSATFKFYLYIDLKSSIYNIEVDLGVASLLDTVIRLNHLWNLYLKVQTWSVIWKKNVTTLCNMIGASPWVTFMTNPSYPITRIHILHTVLCTLPKVLTRWICYTIKRFFCCWSLFSFILTCTLMFDSGVILYGETRC